MRLPESLTTVTPFSKLLAMNLFILFPFVGFYTGMQYSHHLVLQSNVPIQPLATPTTANSSSDVLYQSEMGTITSKVNRSNETATIYYTARDDFMHPGSPAQPVKIIDFSTYANFGSVHFSPSGDYFTFVIAGPGDGEAYYLAKADGSLTRQLDLYNLNSGYGFTIIGWVSNDTLLVSGSPVYSNKGMTKYWKINISNLATSTQVTL